jgi:hypothetical protein
MLNQKPNLRSADPPPLRYGATGLHRLRRLEEGLWVIWSANFPMQRLSHRFGSDPLNLCNLRNLWIFNLRDLGLTIAGSDGPDDNEMD